ncbi:tyrosine-type recombinase/integrase [Patulibacter medicamentivorans]|uniref:tyrosine-type recombinase/integrase n=1 Tax=Patulibacter medicamentivorans TaxID=1097667 RepID=UPI00058AE738|nr:site-specific integrase [Patulibacter medicamentivorans]
MRETWRARYPDPIKGGTAQIERSFPTKREAENWVRRQASAVLDGIHVDPRGADRLVRDVADEWRATWVHLEPKTKAGYDNILRKHLVGSGGDDGVAAVFHQAKLGALTADAVQAFVNELSQRRAVNTVRRVFTVLRSVLQLAVERRYIGVNPCSTVRLPRRRPATGSGPSRMLFLTPPEIRALAGAMPRSSDSLAVYVAAYCGLRAGELWALRRDDVDLLRGVLRVRRAVKEISTSTDLPGVERGLILGPTKTHADRSMRLPGFLVGMLEEHLAQPSGCVGKPAVIVQDVDGVASFAESSDPFDPGALIFSTSTGRPVRHGLFYRRVFRPAVVGVAGRQAAPVLPERLRGLRWHDLRHTCASLSLAVPGGTLHVVKERLGHEDIRTTINIYGHLLDSVDAALADGLDVLYGEALDASNVVEMRGPHREQFVAV